MEFKPSKEASEQGMCHTEAECKVLFQNIDPEIKSKAIIMLQDKLKDKLPIIKDLYDVYGDDWFDHLADKEIEEYKAAHKNEDRKMVDFVVGMMSGSVHMSWGMSIRNLLRKEGFGEKELNVHNLDCVYQDFIAAAAGIL